MGRAWVGLVVVVLVGCGPSAQQLREQTLSTLNTEADRWDGGQAFATTSTDAYGRPLSASVRTGPLHWTLELRSLGPDGLPQNSDDLVVTRSTRHGQSTLAREAARVVETVAEAAARGAVGGVKKGPGGRREVTDPRWSVAADAMIPLVGEPGAWDLHTHPGRHSPPTPRSGTMPHLFEPFTLKSVTLRNRIGVSPMCQYWSENGMPSDWHLVHLGSRAVGGAGLVISEATAVVPEGRISPQDAGIWSDAHVEPWARVARFIAEAGSVAGMQLAHAGRKASTAQPWVRHDHDAVVSDADGGWTPVGPSPLPFRDGSKTPRELTRADIQAIEATFAAAAVRCQQAGFRWLELHFAHGYLAHSFLLAADEPTHRRVWRLVRQPRPLRPGNHPGRAPGLACRVAVDGPAVGHGLGRGRLVGRRLGGTLPPAQG